MSAQRRRELCCEMLERHRFGAHQRPGVLTQRRVREASSRELRDVANIDERHATPARRQEHGIALADVDEVGVGQVQRAPRLL
jgi:hypothetical protein